MGGRGKTKECRKTRRKEKKSYIAKSRSFPYLGSGGLLIHTIHGIKYPLAFLIGAVERR